MASNSTYGGHAEYGDARKRDAQYQAAVRGALKGSGAGLAVSAPGAYFLHKTWQPFTRLTLPLKAMFVTMATVSAGVIAADKAGIAFEHESFSDEGAKTIRRYRSREEEQWDQLSTRDKALTWTKDNKFGFVAGSWIASMGGIFAYINTQPMTFAQKLVQTRVWAQGITLASLVAMAGITQIPSAGDKILYERDHASDHSWRDFIHDDDDDDDDDDSNTAAANKALSRSQQQKSGKQAPRKEKKSQDTKTTE